MMFSKIKLLIMSGLLICSVSKNIFAQANNLYEERPSEAFDNMLDKEYPSVYDEMNKKASNEGDRETWLKISGSMDKEELLSFVDKYPNSEYAKEALQKINEIDIMEAKQLYREIAGKKYENIPPEITEDAIRAAGALRKAQTRKPAPDAGSVKDAKGQEQQEQGQRGAVIQQDIGIYQDNPYYGAGAGTTVGTEAGTEAENQQQAPLQ